jgi:hypothetical protein
MMDVEMIATRLYDTLIAQGDSPAHAAHTIRLYLVTDGLTLPESFYQWLTGSRAENLSADQH